MTRLLLAPHNDDEVLFACWTLLRHNPHVIVCLRDPDHYAVREAETAKALDILGNDWTQLPVSSSAQPDWEQVETHLNGWNGDPYADHFGDLHVWAPAREENGLDGRRFGRAHHYELADLADRVFGPENVTHYLTYTAEGRSRNGTEVPYETAWLPLKLRALACYESQIANPHARPWFSDLLDLREWIA